MPFRSRAGAVALALCAVLIGACATTRPQTGDVSFRLHWEGPADLDLHVLDPGGGHVGLRFLAAASRDPERYRQFLEQVEAGGNPDGETRGILDIDCNADVERACPRPIENIFWPEGQAPRGEYQVWVEIFQDQGAAPVPFRLEIRRGLRVARSIEGTVSRDRRRSEPTHYLYEPR